jgi:arabinan endo-1,5-alpha-L-arabinosidase
MNRSANVWQHFHRYCALLCGLLALALSGPRAAALDGDIRTHDPSTVIFCDGKYYFYATGRGIPVHSSDDGWTWKRAGKIFDTLPDWMQALVPLNTGAGVWAPDIAKRNNEYLLYYSVSTWGSTASAIGLMTSPTLDATDPKYKWTDRGLIINSVKGQKLNAIDPGVLQAPDGTLWLSYGSYIGNVEVVQLDSETGLRIFKDSPTYTLSSRSEASDIIDHDGYYYLFVNRGSCCQGAKSTYNIRMGRSKVVTGPYLDSTGANMAQGGGDLFLGSSPTQIGPGHFGRLIEDGVEKFSCHYEQDTTKHSSVLDIRPLLWGKDGWPAPGTNLADGVYHIHSVPTGQNLLAPAQWELKRSGAFFTLTEPDGKSALQVDATAGAAKATVSAAPAATTDNQLWKVDQTIDGNYRILSKLNHLALTASPDGFDATQLKAAESQVDDSQKWVLSAP